MSSLPVTAGLEDVRNPEMVALALRKMAAGLRSHIEPGRFPGATVLVPLGPAGRPVVTESFRTVPVFSDLEALEAWASPPFGFAPDPDLEPMVTGIGTVVLPDGVEQLLRQGAWVIVFNPAGPGSSHLAGMVGETPLRPQDLQDPPVERGFLGRPKGTVGPDDPRVNVAERKQWREKVARLLNLSVTTRDAGDIAKSLKLLKETDNEARQVGATVSSATAARARGSPSGPDRRDLGGDGTGGPGGHGLQPPRQAPLAIGRHPHLRREPRTGCPRRPEHCRRHGHLDG